MGEQRTFASLAWNTKGKVTRREQFLGGAVGGWIQWRWIRNQSLKEWLSHEGEVTYRLGHDSVRMSFLGGETELRWGLFKKAVLADSFLLLYCAPQLAWFVPLEQLEPGALDTLRSWVHQGVPGGLVLARAPA
jgi:hypothetical protein